MTDPSGGGKPKHRTTTLGGREIHDCEPAVNTMQEVPTRTKYYALPGRQAGIDIVLVRLASLNLQRDRGVLPAVIHGPLLEYVCYDAWL